MLREKLMQHHTPGGFRWRGGEIARIEGLSDAVFAFAVTLLVVSLEVPKTFSELNVLLRGFVPFAICFALLMQVWHEQYLFFRRYNLQDSMTVFLNAVLLFVVLFYVYPLKFLFTYIVGTWMGFDTTVHLPGGVTEKMIEPEQMPSLMAIYGGGYLAVSLVFVLLFLHAYRKRRQLDLNRLEEFDTLASIGASAINGSVGAISLSIVLFLPEHANWAGFVYPMLISPGLTIFYSTVARRRRHLQEEAAAAVTP